MEGQCEKHPGTENDHLCETCKVLMCQTCKDEHDQSHVVTSLQDLSQKLMMYLNKEDNQSLYQDICKLDDDLNIKLTQTEKWFENIEKRIIEIVHECKAEVMQEITAKSNMKLNEIRKKMEEAPKMTTEERDKIQEEIKDIVMDEKYSMLSKYKDLYIKIQEKDELYMNTANSKQFWIDHVKKINDFSDEYLKENLTRSFKRLFEVPVLHIIPNRTNQIFTYNVATKDKAGHKIQEIIPANHFDSLIIGNSAYIIGGMNEQKSILLPTTYQYEFMKEGGKLIKRGNMIKGRFGHKVLAVGDSFIYAVGGVTSSFLGTKYTNHCEKYDRDFDKWHEIKPMIECKGYMTACLFKDRFIYVFGGFRDDLCLDSSANIEMYDTMIENEGWKLVKFNDEGSKWLPVSQAGAVQLGKNTILIFGGRVNKTKFSNDSYLYSAKDNTMKMLDCKIESSTTFYQRQVTIYKDQVYTFDGDKNDLHVFDKSEVKWILIKKEEWNKAKASASS